MRVWIVNPYGTLPHEGWREYRSYMIAKAIVARGHEVVWWISDFEHRSKKYRNCPNSLTYELQKNLSVNFVHCPSYKSNISLARIRFELIFGKNFYVQAKFHADPDVIVLAFPSLFFGNWVRKYVKKIKSCLLVIDILDLWPEIFYVTLPKKIRWLSNLFFSPFFYMRASLIKSSDAVVGVAVDYVEDVLHNSRCSGDKPTLVSYLGVNLDQFERDRKTYECQLVKRFVKTASMVVVYSGSFGKAYDIDTLVSAIKSVVSLQKGVKFVIAGSGPMEIKLELVADSYKSDVLFLGPVSAHQLPSIYRYCDVGLCTYSEGSTVSMPIKFYDYLAAGLVIIHSLEREIREIVSSNDIGINYVAGSTESLVEKIITLLSKKKKRGEMRKRSLEISRRFNSEDQHGIMADFLISLKNQ